MYIKEEIKRVAKDKKAIILAHNYQNEDIQEIADFSGDSLELSQIAATSNAEIIVLCGVHFMAESAAILAPDKKVIIPDITAGCPMADMATPDELNKMKMKHPDAKVVTYINTSAAVKALSDICCTSSNALKIVERVDAKKIIFVPDRNLGNYVKRFTNKEIILWKGYCPTHDLFTREDLLTIKSKFPDAIVMVHPECRPEVIDIADEVLSTGGMGKFVAETRHKKIIVGTEKGMIFKLKSIAPDKEYIPATDSFICSDMKKINFEKLYNSIIKEETVLTVSDDIAQYARKSLSKMLDLSY